MNSKTKVRTSIYTPVGKGSYKRFSNVPADKVKIDYFMYKDFGIFYSYLNTSDKCVTIESETVEDKAMYDLMVAQAGDPELRAELIASVTSYKA